MIYLLESRLPANKSIFVGLTSVYGISYRKSKIVCQKSGFSFNLKVKDLSVNQVRKILKVLESASFVVANDLKKVYLLNNQRLIHIKSYRGLRRKKGFPIRGQRTHTNARTSKKNRK